MCISRPPAADETLEPRSSNIKQELLASGMDNLLATHFAHLFTREPLLVYHEDLVKIARNEHDLMRLTSLTVSNPQNDRKCASNPLPPMR